MALLRRKHAGLIVSPYRGMYADLSYWQSLNPTEQTLHIARTIAIGHPSLVFAGPTAAAIHGFEHQWSIHHSGLYVADTVHGFAHGARDAACRTPRGGLHGIYMAAVPETAVGGLRVTDAARTMVDCGLVLPFVNALPIVNSALAQSAVTLDEIRSVSAGLRRDCTPIDRLLRYANPRCDNGGESLAYATIVEEGFIEPVVQHVFANPHDPEEWYRVDFAWFLPGGRVMVAEYDGMAKYVDPAMTDRKSVATVVNEQSVRERRLLNWAVHEIARLTFDDVVRRLPMINKLRAMGIPRYGFGSAGRGEDAC
ncbi:CTP synthase [Bifidobacterium biavatii]|uniref:CTP synthase n=1 Tax=Bifidobacterium biavatii DSM 23969 TaxID=1437608 RepID=A0A086ZN47_9BIFI|nr:CTP synthase [Bifidobacterium biavatii]KFI47947.1 CTP synthase [Bifidobacterium biavatii DSM 23969]